MQRLGADVFLRNPDYAYRIWEYHNRHVRDFYVAHRDRRLLVSSNALREPLQAFTRAVRDKLGVQIREGGLAVRVRGSRAWRGGAWSPGQRRRDGRRRWAALDQDI